MKYSGSCQNKSQKSEILGRRRQNPHASEVWAGQRPGYQRKTHPLAYNSIGNMCSHLTPVVSETELPRVLPKSVTPSSEHTETEGPKTTEFMGIFGGGSGNIRYFIQNCVSENIPMILDFELQHPQIFSEPEKKANEEPCEPSLDWKRNKTCWNCLIYFATNSNDSQIISP